MAEASTGLNDKLKAFVSQIADYSLRRNEIAHGRAFNLAEHGYCLGPSNLMKAKWKPDGSAKFLYTSTDVYHYANEFARLFSDCHALVDEVKAITKASNQDGA